MVDNSTQGNTSRVRQPYSLCENPFLPFWMIVCTSTKLSQLWFLLLTPVVTDCTGPNSQVLAGGSERPGALPPSDEEDIV